jgi:hypothetical protein
VLPGCRLEGMDGQPPPGCGTTQCVIAARLAASCASWMMDPPSAGTFACQALSTLPLCGTPTGGTNSSTLGVVGGSAAGVPRRGRLAAGVDIVSRYAAIVCAGQQKQMQRGVPILQVKPM